MYQSRLLSSKEIRKMILLFPHLSINAISSGTKSVYSKGESIENESFYVEIKNSWKYNITFFRNFGTLFTAEEFYWISGIKEIAETYMLLSKFG